MAKISRRAGMVAALLAACQRANAATTASSDPSPDSQLIDLVRQLLEAIAGEEWLAAPYYRRVRFTYPPHVETQLDVLADRQSLLRQQIAALPTTTIVGLQAKAAVVLLWLAPDGELPVDADDSEAQLACSLCQDLLRQEF